MIQISEKAKCAGCHSCALACPRNCITMKADDEGFLYPEVNEDMCTGCNLCEKACPVIKNEYSCDNDPQAYAAYSKNDILRKESSSGGMFTEIAEHIIEKGGIVFGAAFDDNFNVNHIAVKTANELKKLRGSKYVQSTIGNAYKDAEDYLEKGDLVLFTGTPCQIAGLYAYLKKDYENLITQDIICHGVPSPMLWRKYLSKQCKGYDTTSVSFRNKKYGWKRFSMRITVTDGKEFLSPLDKDEYMRAFLKNLSLRPSCYNCKFKKMNRQSDFTLADFWGIENILPDISDDKGTSLLIVNSEKARLIFEAVKEKVEFKVVDITKAIKYNSAMIKSADKPEKRDDFIKTVVDSGFETASRKYLKTKFIKKMISKIKRAIKKIG